MSGLNQQFAKLVVFVRVPGVRIPPSPLKLCFFFTGISVVRSSRLLWEQEVAGSTPATPTKCQKATYKSICKWPFLLSNMQITHKLNKTFFYNIFNEKINLLPLPNSLSTQILPPCFSTNSLQRISPKPVPLSCSVPNVLNLLSIWNNF